MAYSIQVYVNAGLTISDMERRIKNLEPFISVYTKNQTNIRKAMEDHEYGQQLINELQIKLDELMEDVNNLMTVIELKKDGEL